MDLKDLASAALMLIVAIIVASIGNQILGNIRSEQLADTDNTETVTNETINFAVNDTYYNAANYPIVSLTSASNETLLMGISNFSFDSGVGVRRGIKLVITQPDIIVGDYNITYEFSRSGYITTAGQEGLVELGDWFETIAIVIGAVIIIGILLTGIMHRRISV